jgi:Fe-S-cluster-containing dehydrogenase component
MTQYAIATDLNRCVGCLACVAACKAANGVDIGNYWNRVFRVGPNPIHEGDKFPNVEHYFLPFGCQHCANPPCVSVCPTGASTKREDGAVVIDEDTCIGCQACVSACPYGVRYLNEDTVKVEKCTLCEERTSQGLLPACVQQCSARARFFGDIDEGLGSFVSPGPAEDASYESIAKDGRYRMDDYIQPYEDSDVYHVGDSGNGPSFVYILRNRTWRSDDASMNA